MLVLDLAAEYEPMYAKLNSFFGQPFIFCMLNNYGGRMGLFGHMHSVNEVSQLLTLWKILTLFNV